MEYRQFTYHCLSPGILIFCMQHLAIIISQVDHSFILQHEQCIVEKELPLIVIKIIVLVNCFYLCTISALNKIKCFAGIQLANKTYTRHCIELHCVKNLWIYIMTQEQTIHCGNFCFEQVEKHNI